MSRLMSVIAALLVGRQLVLERVLELLLPVRVGTEGVPGRGLAGGVELEEILGHVAHGLAHARLRPLPRGAAEPVERRPRRARILLNEIEPLDGDEELVVAGVPQLEKLLRRVAHANLLQAHESADAVVHVDDEIARLEVPQIRQEGARGRGTPLLPAPLFFEDVGVGEDLEARVRQSKAPRESAEGDQDRRVPHVVGLLDRRGEHLVVLQQLDGALGPPERARHE